MVANLTMVADLYTLAWLATDSLKVQIFAVILIVKQMHAYIMTISCVSI